MPFFHTYDGTELTYHLQGEGEPLICVPGGPMRAAVYLGDLGGLSAHRQLVLLDLRGTGDSAVPDDPATYRCDRLVDDVEALRVHLGLERIDLLGHSASGNLVELYAARYPQRLRSLTLVTPGARAVGVEMTDQDRTDAFALRSGEPWYEAGVSALKEIQAGRGGSEQWAAVEPFAYGRWDAAARTHAAGKATQRNARAMAVHYQDGAFDTAATVAALHNLPVPVLVLAGEYDAGPTPTAPPNWPRSFRGPSSPCSAVPHTSRGSTTPARSSVPSVRSSTPRCTACRPAAYGSRIASGAIRPPHPSSSPMGGAATAGTGRR